MSLLDEGLSSLVAIFWAIVLFLLIRLALKRIQPTATIAEWEYQTQMAQIRQRPNLVTIQKIYQTLRQSAPNQIAVHVRDELTGNAALAYDLPPTFFVKNRSEPEVMKKYFKDEELLMFFNDPKRWSIYNGAVSKKLFGLSWKEGEISKEFYYAIERIMDKFEIEIAGITNNSPPGLR